MLVIVATLACKSLSHSNCRTVAIAALQGAYTFWKVMEFKFEFCRPGKLWNQA